MNALYDMNEDYIFSIIKFTVSEKLLLITQHNKIF